MVHVSVVNCFNKKNNDTNSDKETFVYAFDNGSAKTNYRVVDNLFLNKSVKTVADV